MQIDVRDVPFLTNDPLIELGEVAQDPRFGVGLGLAALGTALVVVAIAEVAAAAVAADAAAVITDAAACDARAVAR